MAKDNAKKRGKAETPRVGRPSSYRPEFIAQAEKLCKLGATDAQMADFFEVAVSTLNLWKLEHPEFSASVKKGKLEADAIVAESLFQRARGYTHKSEKVFQFQGQIVRTDTEEHYAPDTTACIFWLKNRQPEQWRDKQEHEHTLEGGLAALIQEGRKRASESKHETKH